METSGVLLLTYAAGTFVLTIFGSVAFTIARKAHLPPKQEKRLLAWGLLLKIFTIIQIVSRFAQRT